MIDWQGRIGKVWAEEAAPFDQMFLPLSEAMAALAGASHSLLGARVLDLGCGAGGGRIPFTAKGAEVTGADISADLLALARQRFPDGRFLEGDAAADPLGGPYDLVISRLGMMFFPDSLRAFLHIAREAGAGARFIFAAWADPLENEWALRPLHLAAQITGDAALGAAPVAGSAGPFGWSRLGDFAPLLEGASWEIDSITPHEGRFVIGRPDADRGRDRAEAARLAARFVLRGGPLAARCAHLAPEARATLRAKLAEAFLADYDPSEGAVTHQGRFRLIAGRIDPSRR